MLKLFSKFLTYCKSNVGYTPLSNQIALKNKVVFLDVEKEHVVSDKTLHNNIHYEKVVHLKPTVSGKTIIPETDHDCFNHYCSLKKVIGFCIESTNGANIVKIKSLWLLQTITSVKEGLPETPKTSDSLTLQIDKHFLEQDSVMSPNKGLSRLYQKAFLLDDDDLSKLEIKDTNKTIKLSDYNKNMSILQENDFFEGYMTVSGKSYYYNMPIESFESLLFLKYNITMNEQDKLFLSFFYIECFFL